MGVALLDEWSDVDHEAGTHIGVQARVHDLERPVRCAARLNLCKARQETRFISKGRNNRVVWMASLPVRQNHHTRTHLSQNVDNLLSILQRVLDRAIRHIERVTPAHSEQPRRFCGFAGPVFSSTARPGFTACKIEDRSPKPACRHPQQGTPARLLHIIAVRRNGQHISRWRIRAWLGTHIGSVDGVVAVCVGVHEGHIRCRAGHRHVLVVDR